jgi:hypothetical protein
MQLDASIFLQYCTFIDGKEKVVQQSQEKFISKNKKEQAIVLLYQTTTNLDHVSTQKRIYGV